MYKQLVASLTLGGGSDAAVTAKDDIFIIPGARGEYKREAKNQWGSWIRQIKWNVDNLYACRFPL